MIRKTNIILFIYLIIIIILAVIYFSVPERELFLENQMEWWRGFFRLIRSII